VEARRQKKAWRRQLLPTPSIRHCPVYLTTGPTWELTRLRKAVQWRDRWETLAVPAASDANQGGNKGKNAGTVSTSKPQKPGKKAEEWTQVKQKVRKPKV